MAALSISPVMQRGTKVVVIVIIAAAVFAGVTLYVESSLRAAFQRHLLVVRATNVVTSNAPSGRGIPADFGPHCAQASFAQSGALIINSDAIPANATGVVYVKYEPDGSFSPINGGGDNVALFFFRTEAPAFDVASTVNASVTLVRMEQRNSTVLIGGTGYGAGQEFRSTFVTGIVHAGIAWTVTEAYTITSLGSTTVTVQPAQPCM